MIGANLPVSAVFMPIEDLLELRANLLARTGEDVMSVEYCKYCAERDCKGYKCRDLPEPEPEVPVTVDDGKALDNVEGHEIGG